MLLSLCESFVEKIQNIWTNNENLIETSKIIVFAFKIFPFIRNGEKETYINELFEFSKKSNSKYEKFINYYKRSWLNSSFLEFDQICDWEIYNRTNNICESFNHKINSTNGYPHPKLAILIEKLKEITVNYYQSYINKFFKEDKNVNNSINLFNDCRHKIGFR